MINLRTKFTKWYYRKGYHLVWTASYAKDSGVMIFTCPLWVRPLVYFFFSPSVYYGEEGRELGEIIERRLADT